MTTTQIGENFGLGAQETNLVLQAEGFIQRSQPKGWEIAPLGHFYGGEQRTRDNDDARWVTWPKTILKVDSLKAALEKRSARQETEPEKQSKQEMSESVPESSNTGGEAIQNSVGKYRCQDGHYVRSRAELVIDDWLYSHSIVHSYEKLLPCEGNYITDFFLPAGDIYIEFWGMKTKEYQEKKARKVAAYNRHRLNLIELSDKELNDLDRAFPPLLRAFGVEVR